MDMILGYTILENLYQGENTELYRAKAQNLQSSILIKVMYPTLPSVNDWLQWHHQYATASELEHPLIAKIQSFERFGDRFALLIVDEGFVTLSSYWQQQGAQEHEIISQTINLTIQLTDCLIYLLGQQVMHQDISLANILINPNTSKLKLICFDIAKILPPEKEALGHSSEIEESFVSSNPNGIGADCKEGFAHPDYYSFGATLFELLVGERPMDISHSMGRGYGDLARPVLLSQDKQKTIPHGLRAIALKLMSNNTENCYQSVFEIKHDLEQCLEQWQHQTELYPPKNRKVNSPKQFIQNREFINADLIEAERLRAIGKNTEAMEFYDNAIQGAKDSNNLQEEALANELAAQFYLDWCKDKFAAIYMQDAYLCYEKYGATSKTDSLAKDYEELLRPIFEQRRSKFDPLETLATLSKSETFEQHLNSSDLNSTSQTNDVFDLAAILKSSQTLTETIQLEELLDKFSQVLLQNSGSDCCIVALPDALGTWKISSIANNEATEICSEKLRNNPNAPEKVIQQVRKSQSMIFVNDLAAKIAIIDPFIIRHQPQSIFCKPLLYQDRLVGIVYLHSCTESRAFEKDKTIMLDFLCSQAAVALENSRIYSLEQERSRQLQISKDLFQQLFENAGDAILLLGSKGFLDCNSAAVKLFQCDSKQDLCSSTPANISPEFQADGRLSQEKAAEMILNAHEQGSYRFEWIHQKTEGELFWAEVVLTSIHYNDEKILHCIVRDISARIEAERALKFTQFTVDHLADAIITLRLDGHVIDANPACCESLGYSYAELCTLNINDISPEANALWTTLTNSAKQGESLMIESINRRSSGEIYPVEVAINYLNFSEEEYICCIFRDISDRKQAERTLSLTKFAIDNTATGIYWINCEGQVIDANEAACQSLGYLSDEIKQMYTWDIYHDMSPELWPQYWQGIQQNNHQTIETYHQAKNGSIFSVEITSTYLEYDEKGYIFAQAQNIDERKQAEMSLLLTQYCVDNAADCIFWIEPNGKIAYANQAASLMHGYSVHELTNMFVFDLNPTISEEFWQNHWQNLQHIESQKIESVHQHQDNTTFPVEILVNLFSFKGEEYNFACVRDIRDRKAAEQELYESQQLLQLVLDTVPQLVFWKDRNSAYLGCNQGFANIAGLQTPPDIIGMTDRELPWKPEETDFFLECDRRIMGSGVAELGIIEPILGAEGQQTWSETNKSPLRDVDGNVIGILGTIQDITQLKEAEQTLKRNNEELEERVAERTAALKASNQALANSKDLADRANQAKSEFLANMSHELRTPLNGILGYAQILNRSKTLSKRDKDGIQTIYQSGNHLLNLINDVLDISKIEARKLDLVPIWVNLSSLLKNVVDICKIKAEQKNIGFQFQMSPSLPQLIYTDEKRLRQVLINLLGNAIKFTHIGCVTFKVESTQISNTEVSIDFHVSDTGIGIHSKDLSKLFDAFEQVGDSSRYSEGTGLGLAISQRIVKMMKSEIQVKSQYGQGSNFFFSFNTPLSQDKIERQEQSEISYSPVPDHKDDLHSILVVDDQADNQTLIQTCLSSLGITIREASNNQEGLSILSSRKIDLIIINADSTDINAFELLKQLSNSTSSLKPKVIILSTFSDESYREQLFKLPIDGLLTHPIEEKELLTQLAKLLNATWQIKHDDEEKIVAQGLLNPETIPSNDIVLPSQKDLDALLHLSQSGKMRKMRHELEQLIENDSRYTSFASGLLMLVKQFKVEAIEELLQQYLKELHSSLR